MIFSKKIGGAFLALFVFVLFTSYKIPLVADINKEEILIRVMVQSLNNLHYKPLDINDTLSDRMYKLYVKRLDFNKKFQFAYDLLENSSKNIFITLGFFLSFHYIYQSQQSLILQVFTP